MVNVIRTRMGLWTAPLVLAAVLVVAPLTGQEPAERPAAAKMEKKSTGRLPTYYAQVVTKDQRAKIYELQAQFGEQLQKLRDQLAAIEVEQKAAIEAVLTPEQRQQVMKLTEDARARRTKRSEPAGAAESTE